LSEQWLAENGGLHVNQIRLYQAGTAQPMLDALVSLAKALHLSLDDLVFEGDEREIRASRLLQNSCFYAD